MSLNEEQFSQEPEDFILDEFHFARLSIREDVHEQSVNTGKQNKEVCSMLKILERDYKQHVGDILKEFPNTQFVMKVDKLLDREGYLMAVSTEPESSKELGHYLASHRYLGYLNVCGCYASNFLGGLYEIREDR